jgi:hypothetical protein
VTELRRGEGGDLVKEGLIRRVCSKAWEVGGGRTSLQWAKGNGELDRRGEEERGKGGTGTGQVGRRREMGQVANGPV